jgi:hypothetical protein
MNGEERQKALILKIRELAGEVGSIDDPDPGWHDADNYDHQVQTGLATAVVEILDYAPPGLVHWFGICLLQ